MIFELFRLGWKIKLIATEDNPPKHLIGKEILQGLIKNPMPNRDTTVSLNLVPPPAMPFYSRHTILFTTLESRTVHEGFLRRCSLFDEVWVPCKMNMRAMKKAGYPRKKLWYCPEGVHHHFWTPTVPPHDKYHSSAFTFFYNGDWSYRKGIDILIRAYANAFDSTENVRLLMLVHYQGNGEDVSRQRISTELMEICHKYNISRLPPIHFIYGHIDDPHMPALYNCADVYASPTRGEAWGLPIIQAMSCGIPAIIPRWGGHRDYCNSSTSFLSDIEKFDVMDDKVNLTVDFYKEQEFCFPDLNHFSKLMRYAFNHRGVVRHKGILSRQHVYENFSWHVSGNIADVKLRSIYETKFR